MELDHFRRTTVGARLKVDGLLEQIAEQHPDLAGTVRQALEGDPDEFPSATIAKVLTRNGWTVSDTAIANWRRRNCA